MKPNNIVIRLALIIIPLALLAAGAGVFWQGTGEPYPFETLRGETVMIRGHGLYRYDTVNSSSQEIGHRYCHIAHWYSAPHHGHRSQSQRHVTRSTSAHGRAWLFSLHLWRDVFSHGVQSTLSLFMSRCSR